MRMKTTFIETRLRTCELRLLLFVVVVLFPPGGTAVNELGSKLMARAVSVNLQESLVHKHLQPTGSQ